MANKPLSKVTVNFEDSVNELLTKFSDSLPWANKLKSNVGTVLTDMIAGTTTNNQFYIEFAAREAFLRTAKRYSSVYALSRSLGVRIVRRTSAKTTIEIENTSTSQVFIPAYDSFDIEGRPFYNREGILMEPSETKQAILYEGIIQRKELAVSELDTNFLEVAVGEPGFVISDDDVRVFTRDPAGSLTEWERHEGSLFELNPEDTKFFDATTGDGDVSLLFGDGRFGRVPDSDSTLVIIYALTSGTDGNQGMSGLKVNYAKNDFIKGSNIESIFGGTGIKDKVYYQKYAPYMFNSKKRMVSPSDWHGNIGLYPGVGDLAILSQRDIAPNDPSWQNVVRVCILPENSSTWGGQNPNPDSAVWRDFIKWARKRIRPNTTIQPWNPSKILTDIRVEVAVYDDVNTQLMKDVLVQVIKDMFKHTPGTLGKRFAVSDLDEDIKYDGDNRREGIDYVRVLSPIEDIVPSTRLEFVSPKSITVLVKYTERETFL